ncbi:hypothetical protein CEXT_497361 [Caerostris extrusa]|uniref:Uncharacterized protein n=1 Tax=Caerostris extrusa TaxID=172846 RepID=A0AAV4NCF2_CAEEX|nr:hypothetical protein CEXT_497361 [Caerostris extrusa]
MSIFWSLNPAQRYSISAKKFRQSMLEGGDGMSICKRFIMEEEGDVLYRLGSFGRQKYGTGWRNLVGSPLEISDVTDC